MGDEGVSQLVESFPEGVVVDPARTEKYRHDWARYLPAGRPIAVGLPEPTRTAWSPSGVVPRGSRLDLPARARRHDGPQRTVAGTLMYPSGLVPRAIPLMGLIGAPLLLPANLGTRFGVNDEVCL